MSRFSSDEHALVSGSVMGALIVQRSRFTEILSPGGAAEVVPDVDGEFFLPSATLTLTGESGRVYRYRITIEELTDDN